MDHSDKGSPTVGTLAILKREALRQDVSLAGEGKGSSLLNPGERHLYSQGA